MANKKKIRQSEIDAIEDCKRRLRTAMVKGNYKEAGEIHNQLGNTYRLLGKHEDALEEHNKEINICKTYNKQDRMGLGIAYRNIGEVYIDMKEEDKAIPAIKMYLKLAQEEDNLVEVQRAYITLGRTHLYKAEKEGMEDDSELKKTQLDFAESYFKTAYRFISETKLKQQLDNERDLMTMKCNNCQNLGTTLDIRGKMTEAVMWLSKAIEIGKKYKLYEYLYPCNVVLGGIYLKLYNSKEAFAAAKEANIAAKSLGNTSLEIESLILQSKALLCMDDIESGKKILRRLRRKIIGMKESLEPYLEEVETLLTLATKISRRLDAIFSTDSKDYATLLQHHEYVADNYATLGIFAEAIKHYLKSVEFAEASGIDGKKLARLYFSIAETYKDKSEFLKALEYYEKEMKMYEGNPDEKFKTQTNITVVMEKLGKDENAVTEAHQKAIDLAREAQNVKKEATAFQNFGFYLKTIKKNDESKKMLRKVDKIKNDNNLSDLEELEVDSQDILDDEDAIDLNNLSSEGESDEDENSENRNAVSAKSKRKVGQRKNEAGETPLHLASKRGDLTAVRRLIRQGHELHVRDTAGWTPLHEASNFGCAEVVAELLKHNARVSDRGGSLCEGITPLHDALSNGHFNVAEILLEHGANVLAMDDSRNLPIDHLVIWRRSTGIEAEGDVYETYKRIKHLLREKMEKKGRPYTANDEIKAAKKAKLRCTSPKFSLMRSDDPNEDSCMIPVTIAGDDFDPDNAEEATDLYKSTIKGLMRQDDRGNAVKTRRTARAMSPGPRTALIPDSLDVHEDWMTSDNVLVPNQENPQTRSRNNAPKRKRNSMEDCVLKERVTRRRRNGLRQSDEGEIELSVSRNRRTSIGDESVHSSGLSEEDDPIIELMDLGRESGEEEFECSEKSTDHQSPELNYENDLEMMNSNLNEPEIFDDIDDLLPSQAPSTSVTVFGRFNEPESQAFDVRHPPTRKVQTISSSDDEDFQVVTNNRNNNKKNNFSSITAAFSMAKPSTSSNRQSRKSSNAPIQTRLPFKRVSVGNVNDSSQSPPEFRRTLSSSSLRPSNYNTQEVKNTNPGVILRLKVRVLEHTLLVPVEEEHLNKTVDWLCLECSARYLRAHGVKPILTLSTKDGAQLSGSDPISLVLGGNELELQANVTSYDLPPLTQRFQSSCADLEIDEDMEILAALNMCESSNILSLSDFNLRGTLARAVFVSLQRHHTLRELDLSGCSLFDDGLKELCKVLPTLQGLAVLDLSSNGLTSAGFQGLCEMLDKDVACSKGLLGLNELNLSHNPFENGIGLCFADLLEKLSNLKVLAIADCDFSEKMFLGRTELLTSISKSRVEELDISYNNWGEIGMEKILQSLNPTRIRSLNCSSPGVKDEERFSRILANFFSRNEDCCNLKELKLSDCGFTDDSLRKITGNFNRLVSLESLDLSNNEMITAVSIEEILTQCQIHNIPLTRLDAGCCPSIWTKSIAPERILVALERKLLTERKMHYLRLTVDGAPKFDADDMDELNPLSKLEMRMSRLWEEYAGNASSSCRKIGNNTVYEYE